MSAIRLRHGKTKFGVKFGAGLAVFERAPDGMPVHGGMNRSLASAGKDKASHKRCQRSRVGDMSRFRYSSNDTTRYFRN